MHLSAKGEGSTDKSVKQFRVVRRRALNVRKKSLKKSKWPLAHDWAQPNNKMHHLLCTWNIKNTFPQRIMCFTRMNVECWTAPAPKAVNVTACIEAGLYNIQPVITKVYREGSCHKQFYMTVIGKIIRQRGWMNWWNKGWHHFHRSIVKSINNQQLFLMSNQHQLFLTLRICLIHFLSLFFSAFSPYLL